MTRSYGYHIWEDPFPILTTQTWTICQYLGELIALNSPRQCGGSYLKICLGRDLVWIDMKVDLKIHVRSMRKRKSKFPNSLRLYHTIFNSCAYKIRSNIDKITKKWFNSVQNTSTPLMNHVCRTSLNYMSTT